VEEVVGPSARRGDAAGAGSSSAGGRAQWSSAVEEWADAIMLLAPDGHPTYLNVVARAALGVCTIAEVEPGWVHTLPDHVRPGAEDALQRAQRGESARFVTRRVRRDGSLEVWDHRVSPARDESGAVTSILSLSRDVSSETAARDALVEAQERLAMATLVGGLGIWDLDLGSGRLQCDQTWHRIMGPGGATSVTSIDELRPLIHPDDVERAVDGARAAEAMVANGGDYTISYRIVRPTGETRWVRSAARVARDADQRPVRVVGFVVDVTDEVEQREALQEEKRALQRERDRWERASLEDPLTQLPNRRALIDALATIATDADRTGSPFCVALIDVDHFKDYNDRYGHLAGDRVLSTFGGCLREEARDGDVLARYGGEEFVLVLTRTAYPHAALARLVEALRVLDLPHEASPHGRVTISVGCVVFPAGSGAGSLDPEALLHAADQAMYRAKVEGRDRFVVVPAPAR
jgi:diguanylate cyclase (GGDEF)-like protein